MIYDEAGPLAHPLPDGSESLAADAVDPATDIAEDALAWSRPFGDSTYIKDRVRLHYLQRLAMIADRCRSAGRMYELAAGAPGAVFESVVDTPVARSVIDDVVVHVRDGGDVPGSDVLRDAVFDELASRIAAPVADGTDPRRSDDRLSPVGSKIWRGARPGDPIGMYLEAMFRANIGSLNVVVPSAEAEAMITTGVQLLDLVCPALARSALAHVSLIAVVDQASAPGFTSLTTRQLPGVIVLSPLVLGNPWQAAEFLLHESMHLKFIDLEQTHSLTDGDSSVHHAPFVRPHWNRRQDGMTSEWPLVRSMTVLHVYTTLALFFLRAHSRQDLNSQYGEGTVRDRIRQARRCLDRAEYLHHTITTRATHTGRAGKLFLDWIGSVLDVLDAEPRPRGSYAHLALDLYDRESDLLRSISDRRSSIHFRDRRRAREILRSCAQREDEMLPELSGLSGARSAAQASEGCTTRVGQPSQADLDGLASALTALLDVRERVSAVMRGHCAEWRAESVAGAEELTLSRSFLAVVEQSGAEVNELIGMVHEPPA